MPLTPEPTAIFKADTEEEQAVRELKKIMQKRGRVLVAMFVVHPEGNQMRFGFLFSENYERRNVIRMFEDIVETANMTLSYYKGLQ